MKKVVAIFSPNQNAYSETFIQAHKLLDFDIKFYYGGFFPRALESNEDIFDSSFPAKIKWHLLNNFTFEEKKILFSLRKEKVDIILAEYGPTAVESLNVIKFLKLPLLVHFHGFDASDRNLLLRYQEQYKKMFEYAKKIFVVSKKMKDTLIDFGCPLNKLIINTYGPNDSFFLLKPEFKENVFVAVGRFVAKKAPHATIKAFKKVVEKFPNAKLIMIGDGNLLKVCKMLSQALNLNENIIFTGVLDKDEIKILLENSVAFVQHSVVAENGDSEGTPVSILEAQAAGLPVISTYHAGIPDVVIHEETGLLVEEYDIDGMSKNMIRILEEQGLAKRLGNAGRERVKNNFSMRKHLKLIEETILIAVSE